MDPILGKGPTYTLTYIEEKCLSTLISLETEGSLKILIEDFYFGHFFVDQHEPM